MSFDHRDLEAARPYKDRRKHCDCGRRAVRWFYGEYICDQCYWLDGHKGENSIIGVLRMVPRLSPNEMCDLSGLSRETVYRVIKKLEQKGRIRNLGNLDGMGDPTQHRPRNDVKHYELVSK